jgi:hypothetical protein
MLSKAAGVLHWHLTYRSCLAELHSSNTSSVPYITRLRASIVFQLVSADSRHEFALLVPYVAFCRCASTSLMASPGPVQASLPATLKHVRHAPQQHICCTA